MKKLHWREEDMILKLFLEGESVESLRGWRLPELFLFGVEDAIRAAMARREKRKGVER